MDLHEGRVIAGKFRLERCIGVGAMGSVWGARHLGLNAPVAIKFMSPDLLGSAMAVSRFGREAQAAAQLRSPHVVQILDHGVDEDMPFIAMEWLEGEDLGARLHRVDRLTLREAAVIATQAAKALQAAQEAGIVHRDLKPSNIFLARVHGEEIVKLLDFGVAKVNRIAEGGLEGANATATGALIGTPNYMSPEQVRGSKNVDHRSDVWALGVILYYAITGKMPFMGASVGDVLIKVCTQPLEPPSCIVLDLPPAVDWFFQRACAHNPDHRYQTATELAAAFSALAEGRPAAAPGGGIAPPPSAGAPVAPAPVFYVPSRTPERKGTPPAVILLCLVAIAILALLASKAFEREVEHFMNNLG
jgi:serine/threonine-protein kinase